MRGLLRHKEVKGLIFKGTKKYKTQVVSYWEFNMCLITFSTIEALRKLLKMPFGTIDT